MVGVKPFERKIQNETMCHVKKLKKMVSSVILFSCNMLLNWSYTPFSYVLLKINLITGVLSFNIILEPQSLGLHSISISHSTCTSILCRNSLLLLASLFKAYLLNASFLKLTSVGFYLTSSPKPKVPVTPAPISHSVVAFFFLLRRNVAPVS